MELPWHIHGPGRAAVSLAVYHQRRGGQVGGSSGGSHEGAEEARTLLGGDVPWTPDPPAAFGRCCLVVGVPDDCLERAVGVLSRSTYAPGCLAFHLSGLRGRDVLEPLAVQGVATAALHPLRPFPRRDPGPGDLDGALVAVEADGSWAGILDALARDLGGSPFSIDPGRRAAYHLGASVMSNGLLGLAHFAHEALLVAGVEPLQAEKGLLSLARATIDAANLEGIAGSLTGPVVRGDAGTLAQHLAAVEEHWPDRRALYLELVRELLRVCARRTDHARSRPVHTWLESPQ